MAIILFSPHELPLFFFPSVCHYFVFVVPIGFARGFMGSNFQAACIAQHRLGAG